MKIWKNKQQIFEKLLRTAKNCYYLLRFEINNKLLEDIVKIFCRPRIKLIFHCITRNGSEISCHNCQIENKIKIKRIRFFFLQENRFSFNVVQHASYGIEKRSIKKTSTKSLSLNLSCK